MFDRKTRLLEKFKESLISVLPITGVVLILSFTIAPIPAGTMLAFIFGSLLLIVGMAFFTLGVEMSMTPMGERMGSKLTGSKKLWLIILACFFVGAIVTISEPDLQVLATQVQSIPSWLLIGVVAVGVGLFLVLAILRPFFKIKLSYLLIGLYTVIFIIAAFVPGEFLSVAFDSGGVTTGPMTVPFIMALGVGAASVRTDSSAVDDSFGLVALCSIGPIMGVMILGLCFSADSAVYVPEIMPVIEDSRDMWLTFFRGFPAYFKEVAIAILPVAAFFGLFVLVARGFTKKQLIKVGIGVFYTYIGLVLFLCGVNRGFMATGNYLGHTIAALPYNGIIIPIAMVIGCFTVTAEPAVAVLNRQVEQITDGAIPARAMGIALAAGVALSLGLSMVRVLTGIPLLALLIPSYAISLLLSFFVPPIFTAIAFDSGGVASGPMTATFVLPFAIGACQSVGGNIVTDAFGVVAMVAMTPLLTIQLLGLYFSFKTRRAKKKAQLAAAAAPGSASATDGNDVIDL